MAGSHSESNICRCLSQHSSPPAVNRKRYTACRINCPGGTSGYPGFPVPMFWQGRGYPYPVLGSSRTGSGKGHLTRLVTRPWGSSPKKGSGTRGWKGPGTRGWDTLPPSCGLTNKLKRLSSRIIRNAGGNEWDYMGASYRCMWVSLCTYEASTTTATPVGWTASVMATAICLVNRSCTDNEKCRM